MRRLDNPERVRIWNSFFLEAWTTAKALYDASAATSSRNIFKPQGGTLSDEDKAVLLILTHCTLAIEARANHLIDELVERGRLTDEVAEAVQRLQPRDKWFLLPKLYGSRKTLQKDRPPHQAVAEICSRRNALVHVNIRRLKDQLPKPQKMLSLFEQFGKAIADMNVVLRRTRRLQQKLVTVGRFK
jgi:hypothetical protein